MSVEEPITDAGRAMLRDYGNSLHPAQASDPRVRARILAIESEAFQRCEDALRHEREEWLNEQRRIAAEMRAEANRLISEMEARDPEFADEVRRGIAGALG